MDAANDPARLYDRLTGDAGTRQVHVAWFVLGISFVILIAGGFGAGRWVYQNATAPETARLSVASTGDALVRSAGESGWRIPTDGAVVREGNEVATTEGRTATIEFFDGSTTELMDDTTVKVGHMRSSRFLKRTKLVEIEIERGLVYATMPMGREFGYSEMVLASGSTTATAVDDASGDGDIAFLLEVGDSETGTISTEVMRVATLRGSVTVRTGSSVAPRFVAEGQQVTVNDNEGIGSSGPAVRELVTNGDFANGLDDWDLIAASTVEPADGSVRITELEYGARSQFALELRPGSSDEGSLRAGVRQEIGRVIRDGVGLRLGFDLLLLSRDESNATSPGEPPFTITLSYVDGEGRGAEWTHSGSVDANEGVVVPVESTFRPTPGVWRRITVDIEQLDPPARQITSILVYASGMEYVTTVTNISLTVPERSD